MVLKESPYIFRTVFSDVGFNEGMHYWELHGMDLTENEIKTGVAIKREFNLNSAFCDYETGTFIIFIIGFAYYGLG